MGVYDKDIRKLLLKKFINTPNYISDPSSIVVNELDVCSGSAIIDMAVVNGQIHGYEIKSERDTLDRLPQQSEYYNLVFDTVTLVVSERHLDKSLTIIPNWWGVCSVVNGGKELELIREPSQNSNVDLFYLSLVLWKKELIELLEACNITKGIKSKTRRQLSEIVAKELDPEVVKEFIRNSLKKRSTWKALSLRQLCDEKRQLLPS